MANPHCPPFPNACIARIACELHPVDIHPCRANVPAAGPPFCCPCDIAEAAPAAMTASANAAKAAAVVSRFSIIIIVIVCLHTCRKAGRARPHTAAIIHRRAIPAGGVAASQPWYNEATFYH